LKVFVSNISSPRFKQIRVFVSRISPPLEQRDIFNFFVVSCTLGELLVSLGDIQENGCEGDKWTACVKEIEGAYLIKNHRNSLLFGYYKLGFR